MPKIKILTKEKSTELEVQQGSNLLFELFKARFEIYSPCGGNGTCGKCKVYIKDEGYVTACLYEVDKDIEVSLPDPVESKILVSQYKYTRSLPLDPGEAEKLSSYPLGIAIDIGTTTMVFYLVNLITGALVETKAVVNPQVKFGADIISRINYCIQNEKGLGDLQQDTLGIINENITNFTENEKVSLNEIVKITISGNTTMLHLLLGEDPSTLAFVPFKPVFLDQKKLKTSSLNLKANPEGEVIILPSISAYIGADIVCGIASLQISNNIRNYLYIDIGTNGEMALVKDEKIYACATAAGPAFEGANISCGMPAVEGAISTYKEGKFSTIGDSPPEGICGSGLIDLAAFLLLNDILKPDGQLSEEFIIYENPEESKHEIISITQNDIRELQLAKSAIRSGINILCKLAKLQFEDIDAFYLAGGFGNYIDIYSAVTIGLIPQEFKNIVVPIGNASGTGAMLALKSESYYDILKTVINRTEHIELSEHEDFAMEFAMNMGFG